MKTLTKGLFIVLCLILLGSAQLFGQEWSAEQKEVWTNIEGVWDAWVEEDLNKRNSFVSDDWRWWIANWHAPYTLKEGQPWDERWIQKENLILYHLTPLAIDIHDDVAIVFLSSQETWEQKDGSDKVLQGKYMEVLKKIDGKWLFIAETGFDFKTSTN